MTVSFRACTTLCLALLTTLPAQAQLKPPPVFDKAAPESVEDLRAIEKHVQKVVDKVISSVVCVRVGPGQGSGVIISPDGIILTAGHVSGTPNRNAAVIMPSGQVLKGQTRGQNKTIDSGMVKITEEGTYPFIEMGKSADLKKGQWVISIGHPGGFRPNRTPVVRLGRVLQANNFFIQTDCTLVGGDSGGPLFDMQGRVVGIHSRIGGTAITDNVHVPIDTFRQTYERLAKGDSWGVGLGQTAVVRSPGGKVILEKKDSLTKSDAFMPCPKEAAQKSRFKSYTVAMKAGTTYTIDMISGDKTGKVLDAFLRLDAPDGRELAQDDDGGGFPHSRIVYKAIKNGDYKVIAASFEPDQLGNFTVKVTEAEVKDTLVQGRVDVLSTLKIVKAALPQLVEKTKLAKIPMHLNALVLDAKGQPWPNQEVTISWDKGMEKAKSNEEGVVRWLVALDKTKKLSVELPKDAHAMLAMTDPEGITLGIHFKESELAEKVKAAGGTVVKSVDGTIKKGDQIEPKRAKCYRQVHDIALKAGKTYTIDLTSDEFDTYLRLEDAGSKQIAEDDDGAGNLNSRIVHTPSVAGVHRIIVTTCNPGEIGAYRLTVREIDAPPAEPKTEPKK